MLSQPSELFVMPNAAPLEPSTVHFTFCPTNHRSVKFVCQGDAATARLASGGTQGDRQRWQGPSPQAVSLTPAQSP